MLPIHALCTISHRRHYYCRLIGRTYIYIIISYVQSTRYIFYCLLRGDVKMNIISERLLHDRAQLFTPEMISHIYVRVYRTGHRTGVTVAFS